MAQRDPWPQFPEPGNNPIISCRRNPVCTAGVLAVTISVTVAVAVRHGPRGRQGSVP